MLICIWAKTNFLQNYFLRFGLHFLLLFLLLIKELLIVNDLTNWWVCFWGDLNKIEFHIVCNFYSFRNSHDSGIVNVVAYQSYRIGSNLLIGPMGFYFLPRHAPVSSEWSSYGSVPLSFS